MQIRLRLARAGRAIFVALVVLCTFTAAHAATLTVDSTADIAAPGDGECTLREAISNSTQNLDTTGGDCTAGEARPVADTIAFAIPGAGPHAITLTADLPISTDLLVIDGLTQPANGGPAADCLNGPLLIEISGGGSVATGITYDTLDSDDGMIRGLAIGGFTERAILLDTSDDNRVHCNFIGTDATGTVARPNNNGLRIFSGADRNIIGTDGDGTNDAAERNLISGNTTGFGYGVHVSGAATDDNRIAGNWFGVDVTGTTRLGNVVGVRVRSGPDGTIIGTNGDGSGDAAEGNLMAGNRRAITFDEPRGAVWDSGFNTRVAGNVLGLDAAGNPLGNDVGVLADTSDGLVVGANGDGVSDELEGNVLAGNGVSGNSRGGAIHFDFNVQNAVIRGNLIGLDPSGTAAIGNDFGVRLSFNLANTGNLIEDNTISGNDEGVVFDTDNADTNILRGNRIGTDVTGTAALPNTVGVLLATGTVEVSGNRIFYNDTGVLQTAQFAGTILQATSTDNCFFGNGVGLQNDDDVTLDVTQNWWGHPTGPGGAGGGAGDLVEETTAGSVVVSPFLATAPAGCPTYDLAPAPVDLEKRFLASGLAGRTVPLEFTITNTNRTLAASGIAFTDDLSAMLPGATAVGLPLSDVCGPGSTLSGTSVLTLVGGSLAPLSGCVVTIDVNVPAGVAAGAYPNVTSPIDATVDGQLLSGDPAADDLVVVPEGDVILVDSTADTAIAGDGQCTLREAIVNANTDSDATLGDCTPGKLPPEVDRIEFALPGVGPHRIFLADAGLPAVTDRVVIDGLTQPSNGGPVADCQNGPLLVELSGESFAVGPALTISGAGADGSLVRGLVVNGFDATFQGVALRVSGADDVKVQCNFFGLDPAGTTKIRSFTGVEILNGAERAIVGTDGDGVNDANEGNVSTSFINVSFLGSQSGRVSGNHLGVDVTGTVGFTDINRGVELDNGASNIIVGTDGDGVSDALEGNVLSGNRASGIFMSGSTGVVIAGNKIGTDASGTAAIPNGMGFNMLSPSSNRIGTNADGVSDALERNIISGNAREGIGLGGSNNLIAGNFIGVDVTGTAALGNGGEGIRGNSGSGNVLGTNGDGVGDDVEGNVISGNGDGGIELRADFYVVAGNKIGTDVTGTAAIPNGNAGIHVTFGDVSRIGTNGDGISDALEANLISGNGTGVRISEGAGADTTIRGNDFGTTPAGVPLPNTVAIRLERNTGATLLENRILGNGTGVEAADGTTIVNTPDASASNCIVGNGLGVAIVAPTTLVFENNWWGSPTGPSGAASGLGDSIDSGVDADPFLTVAPAGCPELAPPQVLPVVLEKRFTNNPTPDNPTPAGAIVGLELTLTNPNASFTATDVAFSDDLGAALGGLAAVGLPSADVCGAGSSLDGTSTIALTGGALASGGSCTFTVDVQIPPTAPDGSYENITSAVTATVAAQATVGDPATAFLIVGVPMSELVINSVADTATAGDGACTLREAIVNANQNADLSGGDCAAGDAATLDVLLFALPGSGPHTITVGSALPAVTERIVLDALSQAGADCAAGTLQVVLDGSVAGGAGLTFAGAGADGSLVRGFVVNGFGTGVVLDGVDGATLACNFLGTDATGSTLVANGTSLELRGGSRGNVVGTDGDGDGTTGGGDAEEGNILAASGASVVLRGVGTSENRLAGNKIGVAFDGATTLAPTENMTSISIRESATANVVGTDGDASSGDAAEGNVVAGWTVVSGTGTQDNRVAGNHLGVDAAGGTALGVGGTVLLTNGSRTTRVGSDRDGTSDALERNVVCGRKGPGVRFDDSNDNVVAGNYLGLDAAGATTPCINHYNGLIFVGTSDSNVAEGNVIAGSVTQPDGVDAPSLGEGIVIFGGSFNRFSKNIIGLDATGTVALGNAFSGINVFNNAIGTVIGNDGDGVDDASEGNLISGNGRGILLSADFDFGPRQTRIAGNRIGLDATGTLAIGNGSEGIELFFDVQDTVIEDNVLGGHPLAILVGDSSVLGTEIRGNWIGAAPDLAPLSNTTGVLLESGALVVDNRLLDNGTGLTLSAAGSLAAGSTGNCLVGNATGAVGSTLDVEVFENNWWGSADGPSGEGSGSGDSVGVGIDFDPFLATAPAGCPTNAPPPPPPPPPVDAIVVNSASDGGLLDSSICTLREAIRSANQNFGIDGCAAGKPAPEVDRILFDIPGAAPQTILVTSSLPQITEPVEIDGLTQPMNGGPAASCTTGPLPIAIEDGGTGVHGVEILAGGSGSTIRGIAFGGFLFSGVEIDGGSNNLVDCVFSGTDPTGMVAVPNRYGVRIRNGATGNLVVGSLISGNTSESGQGVQLSGVGTTGNRISGNLIGTDVTGTVALANNVGVRIRDGAAQNVVGTNGDGVDDALEGNVISGNTVVDGLGYGVHLSDPGTDSNVIAGNLIGTDATGAVALGNYVGVRIRDGATNTRVGTNGNGVSDAVEGNVLSGHTVDRARGVYITDASSTGNIVAGNLIGTDVTGLVAVPNEYGIWLSLGATGNVIGTNGDGIGDTVEGNVLSGNTAGFGQAVVLSGATSNVIAGNLIGPAADGGLLESVPGTFGNDVGVRIRGGSTSNVITGNVIAGNRRESGISEGIQISDAGTTGHQVTDNTIGDPDGSDGIDQGNGDGLRLDDGATALVAGNRFLRNVGDGVDLRTGATLEAGSVDNCLEGNFTGVDNVSGVVLSFTGNWWGSITGPSGAGTGSGDPVTLDVVYSPFLITRPSSCTP